MVDLGVLGGQSLGCSCGCLPSNYHSCVSPEPSQITEHREASESCLDMFTIGQSRDRLQTDMLSSAMNHNFRHIHFSLQEQ